MAGSAPPKGQIGQMIGAVERRSESILYSQKMLLQSVNLITCDASYTRSAGRNQ